MRQPSFDTWTSLFLFSVFAGFFIFIILISNRNKKNYPIAFFVLTFSLIIFQYVLFWTGYNRIFPYLALIPFPCYYFSGPLLYLYFLHLYKEKHRFNYFYHFTPALFWCCLMLFSWYMFISGDYSFFSYNLFINSWVIATHILLYIVLIYRLIKRYKNTSTEFGKIRHKWSNILLILYSCFFLSYVLYYILVSLTLINPEWDYMISLIMTLCIYTIGYFVFKQSQIFDGEFFSNLFLPVKNKGEGIEDSIVNEFYENLLNYIEREKPYIDNELRLSNLADKLGYSTHLLSLIINKKSGKNFNQFINEYRLEEAERMLSSENDYNIKSIYFDVGFNNKVTFYKAFKNKYNCTPLEYKA